MAAGAVPVPAAGACHPAAVAVDAAVKGDGEGVGAGGQQAGDVKGVAEELVRGGAHVLAIQADVGAHLDAVKDQQVVVTCGNRARAGW